MSNAYQPSLDPVLAPAVNFSNLFSTLSKSLVYNQLLNQQANQVFVWTPYSTVLFACELFRVTVASHYSNFFPFTDGYKDLTITSIHFVQQGGGIL